MIYSIHIRKGTLVMVLRVPNKMLPTFPDQADILFERTPGTTTYPRQEN